MATKLGEIYTDLELRDKRYTSAVQKAKVSGNKLDTSLKKNTKSINKSFLSVGKIAAGVLVGTAVAAFKKFINLASDAQETNQKFSVTFRDVSKEANAAAQRLRDGYGLARSESEKLLSNTGDLLTGFGYTGAAALEMSERLNKLAVDTASFSNIEGGAQRASAALTSALLGEREAVKALGIVIREEDIVQRLAAKGKDKLTGQALLQAKAEETLNIAYEQSKNAIGDLERSKDSYANTSRRLNARLQEEAETIGSKMLPGLSRLKASFADSLENGGAFAGIMGAVGDAVNKVFLALTNAIKILGHFKSLIKSLKTEEQIAAEVSGKHGANIDRVTRLAKDQRFSIEDLAKQQKIASQENNFQLARDLKVAIDVRNKKQALHTSEQDKLKAVLQSSKEVIHGVSEAEKKAIAAEQKRTDTSTKRRVGAIKKRKDAWKKLVDDRNRFLDQVNSIGETETDQIEKQRQAQLAQVDKFQKKKLLSEQEAADARVKINNDADSKISQSYVNNVNSSLGAVSGFLSSLSETSRLASSNRLAQLDEDHEAEVEALNTRYDQEAALINQNVSSKKLRDQQLKALEAKKALEEKKLQEKQEKERRKIEREAAINQKNLALYQTGLEIPQAAFSAYKSLAGIPVIGPALGITAAAAATALGLKKLQLISQQPIPKLAEGGVALSASGGFPAVVGDNARFDELVAPLNQSLFDNIGKGVLNATQGQATISDTRRESFNLVVNVAGEQIFQNDIFFDSVTDGITNGQIIVDA